VIQIVLLMRYVVNCQIVLLMRYVLVMRDAVKWSKSFYWCVF